MNRYIYGVHDPPSDEWLGAHMFTEDSDRACGWIVFTEELGANPDNMGSIDYSRWTDRGFGILVRLNHGYYPNGTIPLESKWDDYIQRVQNFVVGSLGCKRWIIGNEMNMRWEWPQGEEIGARSYAELFSDVRYAIQSLDGHQGDWVIPGAVAPWNMDAGDWLEYFDDVIYYCRLYGGLDGICLHTYTHGSDPDLVTSTEKMQSHPDRFYNFLHYRQFLDLVPMGLRDLPVFITETNQDAPWLDEPTNFWIQEAYAEIDLWNQMHGELTVQALCLYCWDRRADEKSIQDKEHVFEDFDRAVAQGYTWQEEAVSELINPGLNLPYREVGVSEVKIAEGWSPWWSVGDPPIEGGSPGPCERPEFKPLTPDVDPRRVIEGDASQCWFIRHRVMDAGVYQRVAGIGAGMQVQFSAPLQCWCSNSDNPEADDGELYARVGVDRAGGIDPRDPGIIWSDWTRLTKTYQELPISTVGTGSAITVFVEAWNKWALSHNDAYLDICTLTVGGGPTPGEHVVKVLLDDIVQCEFTVPGSGSGCDPEAVEAMGLAHTAIEVALAICGGNNVSGHHCAHCGG